MKKVWLVLSLVTITLSACSTVERSTASSQEKQAYRPSPLDMRR